MAKLTHQHQQLLNTVREVLVEAKALEDDVSPNARKAKFDELASACMQLHDGLERSGIPVKHSRTMLQNRGVPPSDPEFYRHIHAAEDLIAIALSHQ